MDQNHPGYEENTSDPSSTQGPIPQAAISGTSQDEALCGTEGAAEAQAAIGLHRCHARSVRHAEASNQEKSGGEGKSSSYGRLKSPPLISRCSSRWRLLVVLQQDSWGSRRKRRPECSHMISFHLLLQGAFVLIWGMVLSLLCYRLLRWQTDDQYLSAAIMIWHPLPPLRGSWVFFFSKERCDRDFAEPETGLGVEFCGKILGLELLHEIFCKDED